MAFESMALNSAIRIHSQTMRSSGLNSVNAHILQKIDARGKLPPFLIFLCKFNAEIIFVGVKFDDLRIFPAAHCTY